MGLFRRGVRPAPLTVPRGSELLLPDLRVTKAFSKELSQLVDNAQKVAGELLETAKPPAANAPPVMAALARLTLALTEGWWPGNTNRDRLNNVVLERTALGAAFALIEQHQDRAIPGEVNPIVTAAIAWQQTALPERSDELPDDVNFRCAFALRAGYYLARMGEDATPDLVANSD